MGIGTKGFDMTDCNLRCWECSRECTMKEMFLLPEYVFNHSVIKALKICAGIYITSGGSPEIAESFVKENAVAFYISRKEYLKKRMSE